MEVVYAITSLSYRSAHPELLAAWIQGHWCIENRLHGVRDVTFGEDASRIHTNAGPQVMAALRNLAIDALQLTHCCSIAAGLREYALDLLLPLTTLRRT